MDLIKVQNGIAMREPMPDFLATLRPESLLDLSWTDPALGVQALAWWPAEDQSPALGPDQQYGAEALVVDAARQVVIVMRAVVPVPPAPLVVPEEVSRRRGLQALYIMYGLTEDDIVAKIIEAIPDPSEQYLALTEFKTSQTFERHRPLVVSMAQILGLDLDALFIKAASLP